MFRRISNIMTSLSRSGNKCDFKTLKTLTRIESVCTFKGGLNCLM